MLRLYRKRLDPETRGVIPSRDKGKDDWIKNRFSTLEQLQAISLHHTGTVSSSHSVVSSTETAIVEGFSLSHPKGLPTHDIIETSRIENERSLSDGTPNRARPGDHLDGLLSPYATEEAELLDSFNIVDDNGNPIPDLEEVEILDSFIVVDDDGHPMPDRKESKLLDSFTIVDDNGNQMPDLNDVTTAALASTDKRKNLDSIGIFDGVVDCGVAGQSISALAGVSPDMNDNDSVKGLYDIRKTAGLENDLADSRETHAFARCRLVVNEEEFDHSGPSHFDPSRAHCKDNSHIRSPRTHPRAKYSKAICLYHRATRHEPS